MRRSNPLPSTLPSSPFCSTLNTSYITASDMCEVCTEAVHSTLNTSYITGFAVCSYLTHLWCSYLSPKTGISVFLFDAFVVFLFEPGPLCNLLSLGFLYYGFRLSMFINESHIIGCLLDSLIYFPPGLVRQGYATPRHRPSQKLGSKAPSYS